MTENCSDAEKEVEWHRAGRTQHNGGEWRKPRWVPRRVRVTTLVRSEVPGSDAHAMPGEYDCQSNRNGAVSIKCSNGTMLGLRLDEFEPIAWRENQSPSDANS